MGGLIYPVHLYLKEPPTNSTPTIQLVANMNVYRSQMIGLKFDKKAGSGVTQSKPTPSDDPHPDRAPPEAPQPPYRAAPPAWGQTQE